MFVTYFNFEAIITQSLYIISNINARDNTSSWLRIAHACRRGLYCKRLGHELEIVQSCKLLIKDLYQTKNIEKFCTSNVDVKFET